MRLIIAAVALVAVGALFWFLTDDPQLSFAPEGSDDRVGYTREWHYFNLTEGPELALVDVQVEWPLAWELLSPDDSLDKGDLLRVETPNPGTYTLTVKAGGLRWQYEWVEPERAVHIFHYDSRDQDGRFQEIFRINFTSKQDPLESITILSDGIEQDVVWWSNDLLLSQGDAFSFVQETIDSPRLLEFVASDWRASMFYGGGAGTPI